MEINDEYIINEFLTKRKQVNKYRIQKITTEELDYLNNRYNDSESINETIIRIYKGYDIHPKCPICGKPLPLYRQQWRKTCSKSCKSKNFANVLEQKYGVRSTLQLESAKLKTKQTLLERYGVDNPQKSQLIRNKTKQTCLERYGVDNPLKVKKIRERIKQTCLERYGTNTFAQSEKYKQWLLEHPEIIKEWNTKAYNTKKKNGTLGGPQSKQEDLSYKILKEKYPDVIRQYRSELYPFNCDFYIPSLDLYIECQYYPTHGNHPFNPNNKDDIKYIKYLDNSKFGSNIWIINDPMKRNTAKQNNLNYLEFFNINELKEWLNKNG